MNLNTTYLGKSHELGFQEYLRYWLSGLPNFWQSNSSSMKGQLEESQRGYEGSITQLPKNKLHLLNSFLPLKRLTLCDFDAPAWCTDTSRARLNREGRNRVWTLKPIMVLCLVLELCLCGSYIYIYIGYRNSIKIRGLMRFLCKNNDFDTVNF